MHRCAVIAISACFILLNLFRQKYLETTEAVNQSLSRTNSDAEQEVLSDDQKTTTDTLTVDESVVHKSTSFQDAQIGSVAQLLDVVLDLKKAHEVYDQMEREENKVTPQGTNLVMHRPYAGIATTAAASSGYFHSPGGTRAWKATDRHEKLSPGFLNMKDWNINSDNRLSGGDIIDLEGYDSSQ